LKAVSEGARQFQAVVVVTEAETPTPPCGSCRQLLWELCGNITVVCENGRGARHVSKLATLLPEPFGGQFFKQ
jgi:cytidine deaminase